VVRDDNGAEKVRYKGADLRRVMGLLEQVEDMAKITERRGLPLSRLIPLRRAHGRLPMYRIIFEGKENLFFTTDDYENFVETNKIDEIEAAAKAVQTDTNGDSNGNGHAPVEGVIEKPKLSKAEFQDAKKAAQRRLERREELHEGRELEKLFGKLEEVSLPIEDWYLRIEETDSGERKMTRYALESGDDFKKDIAGTGDILHDILEIGKQGIEVGRFKGLGEMNAEELWITTMDPTRRTLLRVTLEGASNAEVMFSTLMGEDVERRRAFIEAHALDVKNLDV
jgi:DNA gyrase subunit B